MKVIENNLFTQVSSEESATVSGGDAAGYLNYIKLARTPASPGGYKLTSGEIQTGWDILIGVFPAPILTTHSEAPVAVTPVAVTPVAATPVAVTPVA